MKQSASQNCLRAGWHVAIILDGNGRWATARGLLRSGRECTSPSFGPCHESSLICSLSVFTVISSFPRIHAIARVPTWNQLAPGDKRAALRGSYAQRPNSPAGWLLPACKRIR